MKTNPIITALGLPVVNSDETGVVLNIPKAKKVESPLDKLVFAPNRFGWPDNDIDVQNSTSNLEVKNALERRNVIRPRGNGTTNDDVAIDTVPRVNETSDEYAERMDKNLQDFQQEFQKGLEPNE